MDFRASRERGHTELYLRQAGRDPSEQLHCNPTAPVCNPGSPGETGSLSPPARGPSCPYLTTSPSPGTPSSCVASWGGFSPSSASCHEPGSVAHRLSVKNSCGRGEAGWPLPSPLLLAPPDTGPQAAASRCPLPSLVTAPPTPPGAQAASWTRLSLLHFPGLRLSLSAAHS